MTTKTTNDRPLFRVTFSRIETETLRFLENYETNLGRVEGGMVEYVHILFDRHQVVCSEGLESESFLPGPQMKASFEAEMLDEICTLFPEIDPDTGAGYGEAARRTLKPYEARLLVQQRQRAA